ncbi:MAG: hypothetical protein QM482_02395 [Sulfurospirillum sp.]
MAIYSIYDKDKAINILQRLKSLKLAISLLDNDAIDFQINKLQELGFKGIKDFNICDDIFNCEEKLCKDINKYIKKIKKELKLFENVKDVFGTMENDRYELYELIRIKNDCFSTILNFNIPYKILLGKKIEKILNTEEFLPEDDTQYSEVELQELYQSLEDTNSEKEEVIGIINEVEELSENYDNDDPIEDNEPNLTYELKIKKDKLEQKIENIEFEIKMHEYECLENEENNSINIDILKKKIFNQEYQELIMKSRHHSIEDIIELETSFHLGNNYCQYHYKIYGKQKQVKKATKNLEVAYKNFDIISIKNIIRDIQHRDLLKLNHKKILNRENLLFFEKKYKKLIFKLKEEIDITMSNKFYQSIITIRHIYKNDKYYKSLEEKLIEQYPYTKQIEVDYPKD